MTNGKNPKRPKKRGRPSIAELYGDDETTTLKILLTKKQADWAYEYLGDEGISAFFRSLMDLAMKVQSGEMPDDYDPAMWQGLMQMVRGARLYLSDERGGQ